MLRIRGTIGDLPVDLTLELDEGDWAQLGAQLHAGKPVADEPKAAPMRQDDKIWEIAQELLQKAGRINGPDLLEQLEGLTGSSAAGKRLLVRLRHNPRVKVESGADTPVYCWVD